MARYVPPKEDGLFVTFCSVCGEKRLVKDWPRRNRGKRCHPCGAQTRKPKAVFCVPDDGVRRYLNGEPAVSLAKEYGVNSITITNALKRQGVACRSRKEASAFTDHSPMHEASAAGRATGAIQRKFSARLQGISPDEWTEFSTARMQRIPNTKEWKAWRMAVFARDGFRCMLCDSPSTKDRKLQAHHIRTKAKYPDLVFEVGNGITLCAPCHRTTFGKEAAFEPAFNAILAERYGL